MTQGDTPTSSSEDEPTTPLTSLALCCELFEASPASPVAKMEDDLPLPISQMTDPIVESPTSDNLGAASTQQPAPFPATLTSDQITQLLNSKYVPQVRTFVTPRIGGTSPAGVWTGFGAGGQRKDPQSARCMREFNTDVVKSFTAMAPIRDKCHLGLRDTPELLFSMPNEPNVNVDWSARQAEAPQEKPEDNPVGRKMLDIFRRKRLQEEIDHKAAADSLDAPTNKAKEEELEDLEIDLNNLDQQRSKYERLQSEADKKPAAKKNPPKDDGDRKMPAKKAKSNDDGENKPAAKKKPPKDDNEDKKMPASAGTSPPYSVPPAQSPSQRHIQR